MIGIKQFRPGCIHQINPVIGRRHLLLGQVAGVVVAHHVIQLVPTLDRGPAVVPAVGVSIGEAHMAVCIHFGNSTVVCRRNNWVALKRRDHWIRRIANARRIGLRYVQQVWSGRRNRTASAAYAAPISHESDRPSINRAVQGQLRLRSEAGYHLIGRDGKGSELPTVSRDVIQENRGSDSEAGVRICVIPDVVGIEQVGILAVIGRDTARDSDGSGAAGCGGNIDGEPGQTALASQRKGLADGDGRSLPFINAAADDQSAWHKTESPGMIEMVLAMVLLRI